MSSITGLIGAMQSASAQKSAANTAADAQTSAAKLSNDTLLKMWEKAQADFAPYLQAGYGGLTELQTTLPQYVQNTLAPIAQQMGNFQYSPLPNANYTVNPVTGQITNLAQAGMQQQTGGLGAPGGAPTQFAGGPGSFNESANSATLPAMQQAQGQMQNQMQSGGPQGNPANNTALAQQMQQMQGQMQQRGSQQGNPANNTALAQQMQQAQGQMQGQMQPGGQQGNPANNTALAQAAGAPQPPQTLINPEYQQWLDNPEARPYYDQVPPSTIVNPEYTQWQQNPANAPVQQPTAPAQPMITPTPANVNFQFNTPQTAAPTALGQAASQQDLSQGGVLAPGVPTLNQGGTYSFDQNDRTYQIMLQEKNGEIDKFLAKQGLQGSSAGEAFRQRELDKLRTSQDSVQYDRFTGQRDYSTQTAMDQYGMERDRGDTLYNRLYGQTNDLYNRNLNSTMLGDQQRLDQYGRQYSLASDVYNTMYGSSTDLAKMGAGAAGSAGNNSLQTGQGIGQNNMYAGNALANAALTSGMANASMWNGLAQQPANAYAQYQQFRPQQQQSGGGSYYGGGNTSYYNSGGGSNFYSNQGGDYAGF